MDYLKKIFDNRIFYEIVQIILLILVIALIGHFMLLYFKENLPLPKIKELEDRVSLREKV